MANKEMKTLTFGDVTYEIVDEKARKRYDSEGENSFAANDSCVALGDYSFASGNNTVAGCKGYYIKSIDLENKKIYLCNEKVVPVISTDDNTDVTFETPAYAVGDKFTIKNGMHYILCASITSVLHNAITYDKALGFTEIVEDDTIDGHTLIVPQKPLIGNINVIKGCYTAGEEVICAGNNGIANGHKSIVVSDYGHTEGYKTEAWYAAHAEGFETRAEGSASHTEGDYNYAKGTSSHAEGTNTQAIGSHSHTEGNATITDGDSSHAEGFHSTAHGDYSHAEGGWNVANGTSSHAEGWETIASGYISHASGRETEASGMYSYTEGYKTKSTRYCSHTEGGETTSTSDYAHAEGHRTKASGLSSHAEGGETKASGDYSHSEGYKSSSSGMYAHTEGDFTIANGNFQHVQGKFNVADTENKYAHIVGNGTSNGARSNAHTLDWQGNAWYQGSVTSNGADYAEYFEWQDGNPNNEDRVGLLVTLVGEKIRLANEDDEVLGIISGTAAVLGDNYECEWNGKYLTDDFGRVIYDMVEEFTEIPHTEVDEDGNVTERVEIVSHGFFKHPRINPNYNPEQAYVNRADRPEWDAVGMLGKLYVRDDGSCQVNGYATVGENGIATASTEKTNMRALSRVNEYVVKVLLK